MPTLVPRPNARKTILLKDIRTSGTAGASISNGSYSAARLNTTEGDIGAVSLSSNQFTLQAGTYEIESIIPGISGGSGGTVKSRLFNVTSASAVIIGAVVTLPTGVTNGGPSVLKGNFTISTTSVFELQLRGNAAGITQGTPMSIGDSEIYANIRITRIA